MSDLTRFYEGTPKSSDQIEHYGNKNSGRYRRGSGKNHTGSAHDQNRTDAQKQEAKNIRRNARKAKRAYRRAVKGKRVWRVKRIAKKMRKAGLITRSDARSMRKNARVDKRQLKRLKPQVQEMNNIIRASRVSLKDAKEMYNAPEMKTLETLYIRNEKTIDINQAAGDEPTIEQVYDTMTPDQKSVCMYVASEIAGSENEPDDIGEDPNIIHASGSDFIDIYDSMSDEHKAVIILVASQMMSENNIGGEEMKPVITQGPSPWSADFYGIEHGDKNIVYPGPFGIDEAVPELAKECENMKSFNEVFEKISTDSRYSQWPAVDRNSLTRSVIRQIIANRNMTMQLSTPPMMISQSNDACSPMYHGLSPWSSEFYLGAQNASSLEQSGVKGMKWKKHLKAKAGELVGDAKKAGKAVGNEAIAIKDKGLAALNNAHTKKVKPELDANINILVSAFPHGIDKATGKNVTYKDIKDLVDKSAGMRKMSDKDRAYITNETARRLITNTSSTTSVDSVKQERLNKMQSIKGGTGSDKINPLDVVEVINTENNKGKNIQKDARADKTNTRRDRTRR